MKRRVWKKNNIYKKRIWRRKGREKRIWVRERKGGVEKEKDEEEECKKEEVKEEAEKE